MFGLFGGGRRGRGDGGNGREPPPAAAAPAAASPMFSGPVGDLTPDEAIALLRAGNLAFVTGEGVLNQVSAGDLSVVQDGQRPFAVIIGCADSRAAPTLVFNQGLGRLFIIRVAGNTVDRRGLASVVYAVKNLHVPLVVVLGHTGCGAVAAAEAVVDGKAELDPSIDEMITPIIPAVLHVRARGAEDRAVAAVEENARRVAAFLRTSDSDLVDPLRAGRLKIVSAVKDLHTGEVRFLDA